MTEPVKLHPESILSIREQNDMFRYFSGPVLEDFITTNAIEVQTKRTLRDGRERRLSKQILAEAWEMHLRRFLSHSKMNLRRMLEEYHDPKARFEHKRGIYFALKNYGLEGIPEDHELEREALMLGIALMLGDSLDMEISLLHSFEYNEALRKVLDNETQSA